MALCWLIGPHANPRHLERMNAGDETVVRLHNADDIVFQYRHIPYSLLEDGDIDSRWSESFDMLERTIKFQFAKPHLENWSRLRKAAGHAGILSGSKQPYAREENGMKVDILVCYN